MTSRILVYLTVIVFCNTEFLSAQRVLYSPFIDDEFEVIGKSGDYYWTQTRETEKAGKRHTNILTQSFEIYNARMNLVNITAPSVIPDSMLKQYFISGNGYLDQLAILTGNNKTIARLTRFTPTGEIMNNNQTVLTMPFIEDGNSFLLVRSEDKNRMLLLCFHSAPSTGLMLHAILFDRDWNQIYATVYNHRFITQPFIQDDFNSYPTEFFNNSPLKLANNGEWLMSAPSRMNNNFLLFHFKGTDTGFVYKEIALPGASTWEDVALSVNNDNEEAFLGIVSIFHYPTLKNVQVVHYSLPNHTLDFDSSYRFNTLMAYRIVNENVIHENFIMVPGKGFMLLKEYGRAYETDFYDNNQYINPGGLESVFIDNSISNTITPSLINPDGYTRYDKLGGPRALYNRGDLSLFYFPGHDHDSCWSGIIDKEQTTEFNIPYLSYLVVPAKQRIFLLYNSFFRNEDQFGNTTILDYKGNQVTDEGLLYWKLTNTLNFQRARQIADNEVTIPYDNLRRKGFAIVRF